MNIVAVNINRYIESRRYRDGMAETQRPELLAALSGIQKEGRTPGFAAVRGSTQKQVLALLPATDKVRIPNAANISAILKQSSNLPVYLIVADNRAVAGFINAGISVSTDRAPT